MTAFLVPIVAYLPALWLGRNLLERYGIELPAGPTRWIVLNTFATLASYLASAPF
jgi:hypothetical protein